VRLVLLVCAVAACDRSSEAKSMSGLRQVLAEEFVAAPGDDSR
jgi:hypothetical protein